MNSDPDSAWGRKRRLLLAIAIVLFVVVDIVIVIWLFGARSAPPIPP